MWKESLKILLVVTESTFSLVRICGPLWLTVSTFNKVEINIFNVFLILTIGLNLPICSDNFDCLSLNNFIAVRQLIVLQ
jgi:hypothetical protein